MKQPGEEIRRQMETAYGESGAFGRIAACIALAAALAVLFVYRAAVSDPLWERESAAAEEDSGNPETQNRGK